MPEFSHTPHTQLDRLTVFGMYTGMRLGELTKGSANFWGCYRGVEQGQNFYPNLLEMLGIYWCAYGIVATEGASSLRIELLDIEFADSGGGFGAAWQDTVYDIDDANNYLFGDAVFISRLGATRRNIVSKNGGTGFLCNEIGGNRIVRTAVTNDTTISIPAGMTIDQIFIENTTANAVTGGIKIGTTSGGTDVVVAQAVGANAFLHIPAADILKRVLSRTVTTTLYVQDVAAWNSASLNFFFVLKRLF